MDNSKTDNKFTVTYVPLWLKPIFADNNLSLTDGLTTSFETLMHSTLSGEDINIYNMLNDELLSKMNGLFSNGFTSVRYVDGKFDLFSTTDYECRDKSVKEKINHLDFSKPLPANMELIFTRNTVGNCGGFIFVEHSSPQSTENNRTLYELLFLSAPDHFRNNINFLAERWSYK